MLTWFNLENFVNRCNNLFRKKSLLLTQTTDFWPEVEIFYKVTIISKQENSHVLNEYSKGRVYFML